MVTTQHSEPMDQFDPTRFINRELSWLEFNRRVLALSQRPDFPLIEKAKFLAIWASNQDEFFQVRVAGLKEQVAHGVGFVTPGTVAEQFPPIDAVVSSTIITSSGGIAPPRMPAVARVVTLNLVNPSTRPKKVLTGAVCVTVTVLAGVVGLVQFAPVIRFAM